MKIGDRIYVRGYIDEIRKDTVIVRNDGGYFGTIPSEVITGELPSAQPDSKETSYTHKALDTISRQAAIRWVKTECNPYGKPTLDFESGKKVIEHLKQMPSAQPETHEERTKTHSCDCISRQAAIDAIDEIESEVADGYGYQYEKWRKYFCELPSAQPDCKPINYQDCANAMLKMWMDNVVTDGEYNRIMDKLNAHWMSQVGKDE